MKKQKIKFTNKLYLFVRKLYQQHFWRLSNLPFAACFHENFACIKEMQFYLKEKNATASKLNVV